MIDQLVWNCSTGITKDETGLFALTIALPYELFSKAVNSKELIILPASKNSIQKSSKNLLAIYPIFQ